MRLTSRALVLIAVAVIAVPSMAAAAEAPPTARTWTVTDLRIPARERLSIGFHPGVERAELTATGSAYEVCQALMDGIAGGEPGQSWPSYTGFDACLRSDGEGRVLLPSVVVPTFHVAFLVRGIDGAAVRFSRFRVRYVPADGFFAFAVPTRTATFSVVPDAERTVGVEPVARHGTAAPADLVVRVDQRGRRVPLEAADGSGPPGRTFGPVRRGRAVTVQVVAPRSDDVDLSYVVRWG